MTPLAVGHCEVTFEVHLPKIVGFVVLESREGPRSLRCFLRDTSVAFKDAVNRADRRHVFDFEIMKSPVNLPSSPCGMLVANLQGFFDDGLRGRSRRRFRPTTSIGQTVCSLFFEPLNPLMSRVSRHAKSTAQL